MNDIQFDNLLKQQTENFKQTELLGNKYNKLTVVEFSHSDKINTYWVCECECGNKTIESRPYLTTHKNNASCGCDVNKAKKFKNNSTSHGKRNTPEYRSYRAMIQRVTDTSKYYGARGIIVCDRWKESFQNFIDDMGQAPSIKHTIDRIDNNGNYEPNNCKWSSPLEQMENTSTTQKHEYQGESLTLRQWAIKTSIPYDVIKGRMYQYNKTFVEAITMPYKPRRNRKETLDFLDNLDYNTFHNKKWVAKLFAKTKLKPIPKLFQININQQETTYGDMVMDRGKTLYEQKGVINQIAAQDNDFSVIINLEKEYMIIQYQERKRTIEYIPSNILLFIEIIKDVGYKGMYK